ncbi:transcriptional regulator family: Transcription factor TFIIS [Penicillium taxi]|uniref:transcriptional regulator family: Transcription factor TFIIS n=1 Tax=Penicillium taxi TaxID=168475 RepID=UPI002544FBCB|nr:transcriptional regulator family: Transcription factor TFIIS [Penicillium taxi]KAJ5885128.1 transcriptional regulator family: Transcription factor TFIIS [Penicillium taxi]
MGLDAREIAAKSKALQAAGTQNEPASVIVGILKELKDGVQATEELLRSTRIGIVVNKFKQHKVPEVAQMASATVTKWRVEVNKIKQAKAAASRGSSGSPLHTQNGTGASTPTAATPSSDKAKSSVPPDKRSWKADGVDVNKTDSKSRNACVGLMYDGLCLGSTESSKAVLIKACAVETAAFTAFGPESNKEYGAKLRSLFQNLKNKSNASLRTRVLSGELAAKSFVTMTSDELRSDEQKAKDAALQKENMDKAMVAQPQRSISTSLQCGKCGQRKVTYTEAQTRSADEPMTLFCTCLACGKSWRQ